MSDLSAAPPAGRAGGRLEGGSASGCRGRRAGTGPQRLDARAGRARSVHVRPGCGGRGHGAADPAIAPGGEPGRPGMDHQRLQPGLRLPDADRRGARRPVRPPPHVRPRAARVRPGLGAGGAVVWRGDAHRGAGGAGRRGGHAGAADPDADQRRVPGREARGGHRDLGRHHRPGGGRRPGRRRRDRAGPLLGVDLLDQRARRVGRRGALRAAAARKPRPAAAAGHHRA